MQHCAGYLFTALDRMRLRPSALPARRSAPDAVPGRARHIGQARGHSRSRMHRSGASAIRKTARHLAKRAPMPVYSARRSRSPSSPSVTVSPDEPASGFAPVSTLMPGRMPWLDKACASDPPPECLWCMVSSYMIAPLMKSSTPGVLRAFPGKPAGSLGRRDPERLEPPC